MNHEQRLTKLEQEIKEIKERLVAYGLDDEWLPVAQASKVLKQSPWVIKNKIKNNLNIQRNYHYKMNGNRYLINIKHWSQID
jgi:hypothetical protein